MTRTLRRNLSFLALAALVVAPAAVVTLAEDLRVVAWPRNMSMPAGARLTTAPDQLARAMLQSGTVAWKPKVNDDAPRGTSADVYAKVAPAVVVVRSAFGHGTGFLIDAQGWVITNNHVIEYAGIDKATGARTATVHLGDYRDGRMYLQEKGLPAYVFRADPRRDLALLRLAKPRDADARLPTLKLAAQPTRIGDECLAVGHPAAGLLWSLRRGDVSGTGQWPAELVDFAVGRLAASTEEKKVLQRMLDSMPQEKIVVSTCGVNPGDSGGPLVNEKGEVIAVTFAIPQDEGLRRFSYHIDLKELREFCDEAKQMMRDSRAQPPLFVPDPWPTGAFEAYDDFDSDGHPDTVVVGLSRNGPMAGLLVDLDQDSKVDFSKPVDHKAWDYEFAFQKIPYWRTFYDTDNDGEVDLILTDLDGDNVADVVLRRSQGKWSLQQPKGEKLFDASYFADAALRKRCEALLRVMTTPPKKAPAKGKS